MSLSLALLRIKTEFGFVKCLSPGIFLIIIYGSVSSLLFTISRFYRRLCSADGPEPSQTDSPKVEEEHSGDRTQVNGILSMISVKEF